jgi:hypothetical protein
VLLKRLRLHNSSTKLIYSIFCRVFKDDVGSQKPSGGSFATNSTSASGRPLPTMPPGNSRPTPTINAKQLPTASFGDDDVEESYEECVEMAVPARQGRPLPAVPPNVPPPVTAVGVQRPMPQPNTRSLEKQFSSDDDSYEVCNDIPAPRQHVRQRFIRNKTLLVIGELYNMFASSKSQSEVWHRK